MGDVVGGGGEAGASLLILPLGSVTVYRWYKWFGALDQGHKSAHGSSPHVGVRVAALSYDTCMFPGKYVQPGQRPPASCSRAKTDRAVGKPHNSVSRLLHPHTNEPPGTTPQPGY